MRLSPRIAAFLLGLALLAGAVGALALWRAGLGAAAPAGVRVLAEGLHLPVNLMVPADGSARIFVLEHDGAVRLVESGELRPEPWFSLADRIRDPRRQEEGLVGMALPPPARRRIGSSSPTSTVPRA